MALPKVCGIETEYGIVVRGAENNPVSASSLLINAYVVGHVARRSGGTSTTSTRPTTRGASRSTTCSPPRSRRRSSTPCSPTAPATTSTTPIPRSRHPRCRTPSRPSSGTAPPRRSCGRRWTTRAPLLAPGGELVVYKNNSDGKGNSYGCHENYLLARELPFGRMAAQITPHFVTRQIFCGAGKVGCELPGAGARRGRLPAEPARRLLRGGGRAGDDAQAPDRQHPRRAALRSPRSTAGCT